MTPTLEELKAIFVAAQERDVGWDEPRPDRIGEGLRAVVRALEPAIAEAYRDGQLAFGTAMTANPPKKEFAVDYAARLVAQITGEKNG